jgi:AcrR family transcriptional regulator
MSRSRKDVLTEFRTAEILQAAHHVFAEKGYELATIDDIARRAGVAKGTVYLYYRSKSEVYWAALERGLVCLRDQARALLEGSEPIERKIQAIIASKLRYFEENRDFFRIYYSELGRSFNAQAQYQRQFDDLFLEQVKLLAGVLQQAARRRAVRTLRTEAAAFAVLDLTRSVIAQRLRGWSRAPLDEDIAFTFDLVWKGIGPR